MFGSLYFSSNHFKATYFGSRVGGQIKVFISSIFTAKPVKYWDGFEFIKKPVKYWDGFSWITTKY